MTQLRPKFHFSCFTLMRYCVASVSFVICLLCVLPFTNADTLLSPLPPSQSKQTPQPYIDIGHPVSSVYSAKEHGGHNQNWTSIQSEDGLIYVGHTNGISQWDGETWFNLNTKQSTPVRSITSFDGQLYFGTTDDLLTLIINPAGELSYQSLITKQPDIQKDFGEIWAVAANHHGVLFSATEHMFFYDGKQVQTFDGAVASKHAIFAVDQHFYYKARHLPYIFQIQTSKQDGKLSYKHQKLAWELPVDARVMEITKDTRGQITLVTERHGVYQIRNNQAIQVLSHDSFGTDVQLYDAILANDGYFYISSTYHGLYVLDPSLNILRRYYQDNSQSGGLSMNSVFSVNEDRQGNIWLTGIPNVEKIRPPHVISQFKMGNASTEILSLANTSIGIFAAGNGIFKLTQSDTPFSSPAFKHINESQESSVDLLEYEGEIIQSGRGGIFAHRLDDKNATITQTNTILQTALGRIIQVNPVNGDLLISASDGAFIASKKQGLWHIDTLPESLKALVSLFLDKHDTLWLGSATGTLFKLQGVSTSGVNTLIESYDQNDGLGLGPVNLFGVNGEVLISSEGQLFDVIDGSLVRTQQPMFVDAEQGANDWFSNSKIIDHLIQTSANRYSGERIWYRKNGKGGYFENNNGVWTELNDIFVALPDGGFSDLFVDSNDILWFIRDKAETYRVDIKRARQLPALAALNIRQMTSNNTAIDFKSQSTIELLPNQNNLRFRYALSDSSSPSPTEYRSRMSSDANEPWSNWSAETYRDFTQLAPKSYLLQVQARDAWGRISESQLSIVVLTPWYASKAAYVVYVLLAFIVLLSFAWAVQKWRTKALKAANLALEKKVDARTKEVSEKVEQLRQQQILKDRFFGNVSHEFRTPLTLTIGPLETIITEHKSELTQPVKHLAKTALSNASKMLALVGQVLDLNRLEAGKLPLRVAQYDFTELVRNTSERFAQWASQHDQSIITHDCDEPLLLWFDLDQLEKCISNLLSNAIKYSGNGSKIELSIVNMTECVELRVRDNGVGISESARNKVFERFYQEKSSENMAEPGTGIGLALVKELMQMHHGDAVLLDSLHKEKGSCFVLTLAKGHAHFNPEQIIEPITLNEPSNIHSIETSGIESIDNMEAQSVAHAISQVQSSEQDVTTLLIVDDNQELLNFISLRLSASFKILQAVNGKLGYQSAVEHLPDLIISDVNMPVMTGLELAEKIKGNPQTNTIPVILLTAKATKREVVSGFSVGADDYLTKPFDTSELIMRVNAQINARKMVRQTLQAKNTGDGSQHISLDYRGKILQIIKAKLSEPEFNVEQLATAMHTSRDTLIRKCKKECDSTPLNLIVEQRMLQADALLTQSSMSISEIAYACGFESLAYFSRSYKKHRGLSPSEAQRH